MKKYLLVLFSLFFLLPKSVSALEVSAKSAIVMDSDSGRILYQKGIDDKRLIASTTKIMTAILAIEKGNLEDVVTVGEEVLKMYGSNIYIELHEKMTLRDLLYGLLLRSGNDAAVVIANYIGKDEKAFVKMMNQKAKELGMENTIYENPHGLDEETQNYSTARDMALLSSYAWKNRTYREISGTKQYIAKTEGKTYLWYNRNKLLSLYEYAKGGKTGYTPSAGRTLVTNARKDGLSLTAVTLNDPNEYESQMKMYDFAFANYINYKIIDKNTFHISDDYYQSNVYIKDSFSYPLKESEVENVSTKVTLEKERKRTDGEQVGVIEIKLAKDTIGTVPIYIKVENKDLSWWQKFLNFFSKKSEL